jgi:hypothetical protein
MSTATELRTRLRQARRWRLADIAIGAVAALVVTGDILFGRPWMTAIAAAAVLLMVWTAGQQTKRISALRGQLRKPDYALIASMRHDTDRPIEDVIAEAERRAEYEFRHDGAPEAGGWKITGEHTFAGPLTVVVTHTAGTLQREEILRMYHNGRRPSEIARMTGVTSDTIRQIVRTDRTRENQIIRTDQFPPCQVCEVPASGLGQDGAHLGDAGQCVKFVGGGLGAHRFSLVRVPPRRPAAGPPRRADDGRVPVRGAAGGALPVAAARPGEPPVRAITRLLGRHRQRRKGRREAAEHICRTWPS